MLWPAYIAVAATIAAVLCARFDGRQRGERKPPSDGRRPPPHEPALLVRDEAEPSFAIKAHAMSGYVLLILRGGLLDALEGIFVLAVAMLSMWRRAMSGKDTSTTRVVASSKRVGPNIWTGWVVFYTRRLYSRIEDCWNRPITGEASSSLQLCVRKRVGFGDGAPLRMTGATQRCLNLGSYNYLGFGGVEQARRTPLGFDHCCEFHRVLRANADTGCTVVL